MQGCCWSNSYVLPEDDHQQLWGGKHPFASYLEPALWGQQVLDFFRPQIPSDIIFQGGKPLVSGNLQMIWSGPSICNSGRRTNSARDSSHPVRRGRGADLSWGICPWIMFVFPLMNLPLGEYTRSIFFLWDSCLVSSLTHSLGFPGRLIPGYLGILLTHRIFCFLKAIPQKTWLRIMMIINFFHDLMILVS